MSPLKSPGKLDSYKIHVKTYKELLQSSLIKSCCKKKKVGRKKNSISTHKESMQEKYGQNMKSFSEKKT